VPRPTRLKLTARQNLIFHAAYVGFSRHEPEERADALIGQFGFGERGDDKVDRYSGGMAQRLMIARALMHAPDLLFLDEPTTGLDPRARLFVWDRVKELKAQGMTVLITTHDMDEAEALCSRVAIMDNGKIKAIEDRLLAPLAVAVVGMQKIATAAPQGLISGAVIFPLGAWISGSSLHLSMDHISLIVLFCVLATLVGGALGLTLGTAVDSRQISIMFALVLTPLLFTGRTQYPWAQFDNLKWFQVLTLVNPITYASEGLRGALVPPFLHVPHMDPAIAVLALVAAIVLFSALGLRGFMRRAVD